MKQTQLFLLLGSMAGALYFAKNIKVSVTGAEALSMAAEDPVIEAPFDEEGVEITAGENRLPSSPEPQIIQAVEKDSPLAPLVNLLREQKLCEFLDYSKKHSISRDDQYRALTMSFNDPEIKDLEVFLDPGLEGLGDFQSEMARAFVFGSYQGAFSSLQNTNMTEYDKGMSEKDKDLIELHNRYLSSQKKNLYFALLKNNVFVQYKNLPVDVQQELYERVMGSSYYRNPAFETMRRVYHQSKNNVAQFHLASFLFNKVPVSLDRAFVQRTIWAFYDPDMRDHLADLFQKYLERNQESTKTYGYESSIYYAYKHSIPYQVYETLPDPEEYDVTRDQPVYQLADLSLDTRNGCDQKKVEELATKLRAL